MKKYILFCFLLFGCGLFANSQNSFGLNQSFAIGSAKQQGTKFDWSGIATDFSIRTQVATNCFVQATLSPELLSAKIGDAIFSGQEMFVRAGGYAGYMLPTILSRIRPTFLAGGYMANQISQPQLFFRANASLNLTIHLSGPFYIDPGLQFSIGDGERMWRPGIGFRANFLRNNTTLRA